ncbi:uncharacterized protein I303_103627 [Kwoniella dejecticola CBS 10117]|uniref:Zn(2)-C6 fungal-type domain-containing protein n=1 Tax=Kwoniella dejecticola CBS 10117 TaxID=1296121 RepID=A0A1A6A7A0_9TREE|nr:uncharacterized protein I303_03649 [Kwoniella dejecticola CBS 10117]OBR85934.1 hypothetical protein I303_03649 [Kwoniella dejecticola CBS 10117]
MPVDTPASAGSSRRASGEETRASTNQFVSTPKSASGSSSGRKVSATATPQSQMQKELAEAEAKRRKVQRACDACRRKKIKCEGPMNSLSESKCTHCQEYGLDCTYVEAAKRRGPPKGYIETLEQRCNRLERILHQAYPSIDLNEYVGPQLDREEFDLPTYQETLRSLHIPPFPSLKPLPESSRRQSSSGSSLSPPAPGTASPAVTVLGPSPWRAYERDPTRGPENADAAEEAEIHEDIAKGISKLNVKDAVWRYHGKASGAHLMRIFHELKYTQQDPRDKKDFLEEVNRKKRTQYWQLPEWELVIANEGIRSLDLSLWPEADFATELIDAYFGNLNPHLPLLNRVLFKRQYESGLWKSNTWFAKVCLMVFANGSRFVDDDRVYWPVDLALSEEGKERLQTNQDGSLRYSAGWKYLHALLRMGRSIMQGPNLYEFQTQVLLCNFLMGSAVPHLMWILSGVGLRSAQEIGIHVRSTLIHVDPIERALYNRAFWCLYHIDRVNCAGVGRSVALQDTDFDADYPIDVDDEYWDTGDPEKDFKQPEEAGISTISAFIQTLKLDHIIGATLRTIYAINKLPEHQADTAAQSSVVIELDSALNSWADNVPDELRWDPTRSDYQLFEQSALLYVHYYYCQILIHRPFIPTPRNRKTGQVFLPSLAICANAARSICNIVDTALKRGRQEGALPGRSLNIGFMLPSWVAAIVLLINIYSGRQSPAERERAITDIRRCIAASREMEMIWRQAGKMTDMMTELAIETDMPRAVATPKGEKRSHSNEDKSSSCSPLHLSPSTHDSPRSTQPKDNVSQTQSRRNFGPNFDDPRLIQATTPAVNNPSAIEEQIGRVPTPPSIYGAYYAGKPHASLVEPQPSTSNLGPLPYTPADSNTPASINMVQQQASVPAINNNYNNPGQGQFTTFMGGSLPIPNLNFNQTQPALQQPISNAPVFGNTQSEQLLGMTENSFENSLFDLGSSVFDVTGQGEETDIWTQLFTDYTGQNINGDWNWSGNSGNSNTNPNTNTNTNGNQQTQAPYMQWPNQSQW